MPSFQPYHDVPGIEEYDGCLSTGPQWVNIDPSLELIDPQDGCSSSHAWYTQQRLHNLQQSINSYNQLNSFQMPEEKFSRLGLQSQWNSESTDMYRHMRYLSPGGAYGATSATDSTTSEEALSPEVTRQYPATSRVPFSSHHTYCSPTAEVSFTTGNSSWMPPTLYSNALPSSPYAPSDHSACNMKDLQYSRDEDVEEERPSATEHQPPFLQSQPEELAFADEGLGRSIGDQDSIKESDDSDEEPQNSDFDSDYSPNQNRKHSSSFTSRAGRSSPRRTRSLQTSTSATLNTNNKIIKPAHANNRRMSSTKLPKRRLPIKTCKKPSKQFPCTFSHYGCASIFQSKNEWKRHVSSQHLQLGFYRCDAGYCNPDVSPGKGRNYNDFNRKDLFTQHHRRMHLPFTGKYENASQKQKDEFDASMEAVRERCWVVRREKPAQASCGVCCREFIGENAWEERMEHVGKHFERGEGMDVDGVDEDEYLTQWAVGEGLVRDLGSRGRWLVGLEPGDADRDGNDGLRPGRRGRRTAVALAVKAEDDEEEDEDED